MGEQNPSRPVESVDHSAISARKWGVGFVVLAIAIVAFVGLTGFFVVPPIGGMPEGVTVWYVRAGLNLPFVSSPDSLAMGEDGRLSLMGRAMGLSVFTDVAQDRILGRFPYSDALYRQSTGGRSWDF